MGSRSVFTLSVFSLILRVNANDKNDTINSPAEKTNSVNQLAKVYVENVGAEHRITWKVKRGKEEVEYGDVENCLGSTTVKDHPLCDICTKAMNKTLSAEEKKRLQEAVLIQGTLIFPNTNFQEKLVDILVCTYYPNIGIGRFYLTRGKTHKSAYLINNAGVQKSKNERVGVETEWSFQGGWHQQIDEGTMLKGG